MVYVCSCCAKTYLDDAVAGEKVGQERQAHALGDRIDKDDAGHALAAQGVLRGQVTTRQGLGLW